MRMKKTRLFFILILTLIFFCFSVSAEELNVQNGSAEVKISVSVPDTHKIIISAPDSVKVSYNGVYGNSLDIPRIEEFILNVEAEYRITKIIFRNNDITQSLSNGKLTLSGINVDNLELKVEIEKVPVEKTGSNDNTIKILIAVLSICALGSASVAIVLKVVKKK